MLMPTDLAGSRVGRALAHRHRADRRDDGRLLRLHPAGRVQQTAARHGLVPGLSLGILLGALVIVAAWVLIWIYVRWANTHYDAAVQLRAGELR